MPSGCQDKSRISCSNRSRPTISGLGLFVNQTVRFLSWLPNAQHEYTLPPLLALPLPLPPLLLFLLFGLDALRKHRGLNAAQTTGSLCPTKSHSSFHSLPLAGRLRTTAMLTGDLNACGQHRNWPSGDQHSRRKRVFCEVRCERTAHERETSQKAAGKGAGRQLYSD